MDLHSAPRYLPACIFLAIPILMCLPFPALSYAQEDSVGTQIDVGTFTVRIPNVDDWTINVDKDKGLVEFSRNKQKLLRLFSSGAGGQTSMVVSKNSPREGSAGFWLLNEQEMAHNFRLSEVESMRRNYAPRGMKLSDIREDSIDIEGKLYYRLAYSARLGVGASDATLCLYFPPEFQRTREFFSFLINDSYVSGSIFASVDLEQVKPLMRSLKMTGSTSTLEGTGGELLQAAARGDSAQVVKFLQQGVNPNLLPSNGRGALALAALFGHPSIVRYLVEHGADVNPKAGFELYTPLTSAILGHERQIADYLLDKGASVNTLADSQWSPLIRAIVMHCDSGFVASLLAYGADPNLCSNRSPLMHAAEEGLASVATLLLDRGADVNWHNGKGTNALLTALKNNQQETARILLARGADPNATSKVGDSPLIFAAHHGDTASLSRLIQLGAKVNAVNEYGSSALTLAADEGYTECARLLLNQGANIDQKADDGRTALYLAIQGNHLECARLLLDKGANVNASTQLGWTPLMAAAKRAETEAIELLISRGAKLDLENNKGDTALDIAEDGDLDPIVAMLKKASSPK